MTDTPTRMTKPRDREDYNDPDAQNAEQSEAGTQAQDVADDALGKRTDLSEDSEPGGEGDATDIVPRDVPDLVDRMKEMNRSGKIDMDAFAGEDDMDDADGEDS